MAKKVALFAVVLMALLASCSNVGGPAVNLNINLGNEPPNLDQHTTTDTISIQMLSLVVEGLVRYDDKGGYMPGMAEKWEVSPDGTVYTFTLRKGAQWSNGDPVKAEDFVYGLRRALDPATASEYAYILYPIKNAQAVNEGTLPVDQVGVKADGNKVIYTLERPTPYILSILNFPTAMPGNQAFIEAQGAEYASEADKHLFNGPYTIKEWLHSDKIVLAKNPKYWNAKNIKLDTITGYMIADSNTSITMFFNKELDMIGVPGTRLKDFADKGYATPTYSDGAVFYLEFNTLDPVLANAKIRKALSFAVDRAAFTKNVLMDQSMPAMSIVAPYISSGAGSIYRDVVPQYFNDHDVAAAKAMLAEGMQELGLTALPSFSMISDDGDRAKSMAAAIQDMVRTALGVDFTVDPMPFKARLQKMTDKDFQIVFAGWGPDYNDPMTFLDMWTTGNGNNHTSYASAAFDDLILKATNETDLAKRLEILKSAEKMLMDDMPIAPVYFRMRNWAHQENISGVVRRNVGPDPDLYWTVKK
ncbi:MAG: peptide ABC transporter substrate-binding protein [Spirochaetia bacterium]|nr:peptide ABC transporter substrate-binding protein [Spirochaetia bacterium]